MKKYFNKYYYNKEQQKGILVLIGLLLLINSLFFVWNFFSNDKKFVNQPTDWEKNQIWLDSTKLLIEDKKINIYPFNPNFINDYKGAQLGMNTNELDKLYAYRKLNKFVNSPEEFQKITGVSDSLLATMVPYFKFPDWVNNKSKQTNFKFIDFSLKNNEKIIKKSINFATTEDLVKISGIGDGISSRILIEKEKFGGFASIDQIKYIWGIDPLLVPKLKERFFAEKETVKKWNVNEMSLKELASFPYFNYAIAKNIVSFRSMNGNFKNIEDLKQVRDFPLDKIEIINFYIEF